MTAKCKTSSLLKSIDKLILIVEKFEVLAIRLFAFGTLLHLLCKIAAQH